MENKPLLNTLYLPHLPILQGLYVQWATDVTSLSTKCVKRRQPRRHISTRTRLHQVARANELTALAAYEGCATSLVSWESIAPPDHPLHRSGMMRSFHTYSTMLEALTSKSLHDYSVSTNHWEQGECKGHHSVLQPLCDRSPGTRRMFYNGLPDLWAQMGNFAPHEVIVLTPTFYHSHSPNSATMELSLRTSRESGQFSICFDTGCTMASTFSAEDFLEPPVSGNFGSMRMVSGEVEIVSAGMIQWKVVDDEGEGAYLRVPGYYIPKSDQCLVSPQQYAAYHQWGDNESNCFGGNDKQCWVFLSGTAGEPKKVMMQISSLDGLPYLKGLVHNLEAKEEEESPK